MEDDYALFISIGLFGLYVVATAMSPREERGIARSIIALLVAILFYMVLKQAFIFFNIQPP